MPNTSQEPPASSNVIDKDLKDMDVLCSLKIKIESQKLKHDVSKTSEDIQIKIKIPNYCQETPAFSKAQNHALKDMNILFTFKIKRETQKLQNWCIKHQWQYPNQAQD